MVKNTQQTHRTRAILTTGLSVLASASLMLASPATAQEVTSVGGLKLQYTEIKTGAPHTYAEGEFPYAVDPFIFDCPGAKGTTCTVEIRLDTLFSNVSEGAVAGAAIMFDNSAEGIAPSHMIGMDDTSTTGMSNSRSFTWVKRAVKKGVHRIHSYLMVSDGDADVGAAGSFTRTMTVHVYKP